MRSAVAVLLLALLSVGRPRAQLRPFGGTHAIVGARIEVGDGRVIEKGDVLIRDGFIEAVGTGLTIPPDAEVLKGDGLVVFPGFVDGCLNKGLKLPEAQPNQDAPPARDAEASPSMREANRKGIRSDVRAADWLAFADSDLTTIRKSGFTTALVAASGGLMNGMASLVDLSGRPRREAVLRAEAAICLALRPGGAAFSGSAYPGTLLGVLADLRQTLLDSEYERRLQSAFDAGGSRRPPYDPALTGLLPALDAKVPALVEADSETDVHRALDLAQEFHLHAILCGGAGAWKHADRFTKASVPVIIGLKFPTEPKIKTAAPALKPDPAKPGTPPPANPPAAAGPPTTAQAPEAPKPSGAPPSAQKAGDKPADPAVKPADKPAETEDPDVDVPEAAREENHRLWAEKVANARRLYQAGVLIAFTSRGLKSQNEFWENLRKAIQDGLPREAALKALTVNAARILGVDRQIGTVEAGKIANLTVMSADFVDPKAETRYLYIDGWKFDVKLEKPGPPPPGSDFPPFGERGGAR